MNSEGPECIGLCMHGIFACMELNQVHRQVAYFTQTFGMWLVKMTTLPAGLERVCISNKQVQRPLKTVKRFLFVSMDF